MFRICLMNTIFVLTFDRNHVFSLISKVKWYHKIELLLVTLERFKEETRHKKLLWMIWAHVFFNLHVIALKTTIDTSFWSFKKWFYRHCDHVLIQKCINDVVIEFIHVLMFISIWQIFVIFSSCMKDIVAVVFTAQKVSVFGVILFRISPHLGWTLRDTLYLSISPNAGKS